jgi:hypothetical protein
MNKRIKKKYDKYCDIESKRWHVHPMRTRYIIPKSGYESLPPNIGRHRKQHKQLYVGMMNDRSFHKGGKIRKRLLKKLREDRDRRLYDQGKMFECETISLGCMDYDK